MKNEESEYEMGVRHTIELLALWCDHNRSVLSPDSMEYEHLLKYLKGL